MTNVFRFRIISVNLCTCTCGYEKWTQGEGISAWEGHKSAKNNTANAKNK